MKKILRLIPALIGISLLILSCSKEQPEQPKDVKVTDITLNSESLSLVEGDSQTLTATISPSNATNKKIVWSSSDASVASVDNGKVTAIKEGGAIIIATSEDGGKTATCKVTVGKTEIPVTGITLDNTSLNLIVGDETTLIATILPEDATNKKVIWSSSDAQIVSVDEGKVKAIKEGEVTITATSEDGGKTATCTVKVTKPKDAYICFSVVNENESNALSITNLNAILQYSYDSIAWHYCEEGEEIPFGNGKQVFVRGLHNGDGNGPIGNFKLKDYTAVSCSGDIMYLLEYESHGTAIRREECFKNLFSGCSLLTQAPELPATQLAQNCYSHMFQYCSSLTQAPELPATQLADSCYVEMFSCCSSLTQAPELPATQLAGSCYEGMFYECRSLTQAPELPATQLARWCYSRMFKGCSSLTQAPALPVTQLAGGCYAEMFYECRSLTQAPELPATQLAGSCYEGMFYECRSLTQAPELPATQLAVDCYDSMFSGCSSLTQAPALPVTQLAEWCYDSMFSGCSSLTQAPELPATQLAERCYYGMFSGCSSLTQAPELPATQLAQSCYEVMFARCSSLTQAPELPATQLASRCYAGMFSYCTSLTQAPALPATQLAELCYYGMFKDCSSLTQAPELPATQLAERCYQDMFWSCTSLSYVKAMFIQTGSDIVCWLVNVSKTGTFVKNKAATWDNEGVVPSGWTVEYAEK